MPAGAAAVAAVAAAAAAVQYCLYCEYHFLYQESTARDPAQSKCNPLFPLSPLLSPLICMHEASDCRVAHGGQAGDWHWLQLERLKWLQWPW